MFAGLLMRPVREFQREVCGVSSPWERLKGQGRGSHRRSGCFCSRQWVDSGLGDLVASQFARWWVGGTVHSL